MKNSIRSKLLSISSIALLTTVGATPLTVLTSCGKTAKFFKVYENNNKGGFDVEFCDKGASIYGIKYQNKYITYSPAAQKDFLNDKFFHGKGLGRVAGRIADGKFNMGGEDHILNINETSTAEKGGKNNTLHGGKEGFSSQFFNSYVSTHYSSTYGNYTTVAFNYVSADGEGGFPGVLDSWFIYNVYETVPRMEINIIGIPSIETPVDLTNHPYFRLPYKNEGEHTGGKVRDHGLQITGNDAGHEIAVFRNKDTSGGFLTDQIVEGTASVKKRGYTNFDFGIGTNHTVGERNDAVKAEDTVSNGYDHIWYMGDPKSAAEDDLNKIILDTDAYKLTVKTDANAVIVYANCWPYDGKDGNLKIDMNTANGTQTDEYNGGITVEPFTFFKEGNLEEIYHSPSNPYTRKIIYEIKAK